jgi:putative ABC transport system permease protein
MEYKNLRGHRKHNGNPTGTEVWSRNSKRGHSQSVGRIYLELLSTRGIIKYGEKVFDEQRILFADQPFFKIFSFNLEEGDASSALDAPDKIVLTRSMAKKYFGNNSYRDAINKTITVFGKDMKVSAICEDVPQNSQIKFDFVTQFFNLGNYVKAEKWWEANWITYCL